MSTNASPNTSTRTRAVPVRAGLWRVIAPTGALAGYIEAGSIEAGNIEAGDIEAGDRRTGTAQPDGASAAFTASRVPAGTARRIPIGTFWRLEDAVESMR